MASKHKIVNWALISVFVLWLIFIRPANSGRSGFTKSQSQKQAEDEFDKGSSSTGAGAGPSPGSAGVFGARELPLAPNPFHHHGFGNPAPPPPESRTSALLVALTLSSYP